MRKFGFIFFINFMLVASFLTGSERMLVSPGFPPSKVDKDGVIVEDWGSIALTLQSPAGAKISAREYRKDPFPMAVTTITARDIVLEQTAFRAPVWPGGMDILFASVRNNSGAEKSVRLKVQGSKNVVFSDVYGLADGRRVFAGAKGLVPERKDELDWGCTGGVTKMPLWAKPAVECDPGFKNISAGMGGVPIKYRFAVPKGAVRNLVLGFCESYWNSPGKRPLIVYVEGAKKQEIDPVKKWGQHKPGCLLFKAVDSDNDGKIQVVVAPYPNASDKNTILNVIWVFKPDVFIDLDKVLKGGAQSTAEYYVDVGGKKDQLIYKEGYMEYKLKIEENGEKKLLFFIKSPGGGQVPDPDSTAWNADNLRKAAEDVLK